MLYPLTFKPNFKDYIWGGRRLSAFGKVLPEEGRVAESWELSAHPNGMSVVAEGPLAGESFQAVIDQYGDALMGTAMSARDRKKFPLLIKLIDAKRDLSIQVHPDDAYAYEYEDGEYGKNEMWVVLDAPKGAKLVAGVKDGVTREDFADAIDDDTVLDCMNYVDVEQGDAINIPAGMVHAITEGLIIYEVQQNSDTTYRVYDYNRPGADGKPRELHVDKALDVIDFDRTPDHALKGLTLQAPDSGLGRRLLVANRYFAVEALTVPEEATFEADGSRFYVYTVIEGQGELSYQDEDGETCRIDAPLGKTFFIPASLGTYTFTSTADDPEQAPLKLIRSYIPDRATLFGEIARTGVNDETLDRFVGLDPRPVEEA